MSVRLPQRAAPPARERNGGTLLALFFLLGAAGTLLGLVWMILPQALGLVFVVGGFCGLVPLHYFTWGRLLTRISAEEPADGDRDDWTGNS